MFNIVHRFFIFMRNSTINPTKGTKKMIGQNIKKYRLQLGLTQAELALRVNQHLTDTKWDKAIVSRYENNLSQPTSNIIKILCTCLNVSPNEIFNYHGIFLVDK